MSRAQLSIEKVRGMNLLIIKSEGMNLLIIKSEGGGHVPREIYAPDPQVIHTTPIHQLIYFCQKAACL